MRKRFSERYGFKDIRDSFQINSMDDALKNRLWNTFKIGYIDTFQTSFNGHGSFFTERQDVAFFEMIYDEFFKLNENLQYYKTQLTEDIKSKFLNLPWFEIYDFTEYAAGIFHNEATNKTFRIKINQVLENEMSGYRFIDEFIAPIVDNIEIEEIESAIGCKYEGVKRHLSNALEHLSDRKNPDYINSIKESISAVESTLNLISDSTNITLSKALANLPFEIDSSLNKGFIKLYNWTSSADGIRHGDTGDEIKSSFEEAKYMLVSCSAFINYLIAKKGLK